MATLSIISNSKFNTKLEFRNFPLTFVNSLRRIVLSDIPTVVIRDVQIITNTSQMPHEMLKHRMELLPVNVEHTNTQIIKECSLELKVTPQKDYNKVTTDDFIVTNGRANVLMKDRELDTPLLFLHLKPNEGVHIKAKLAVENSSQVSNTSMSFHVDPQKAEYDRSAYLAKEMDKRKQQAVSMGVEWDVESDKKFIDEDNKIFDNHYIQRSYSKDLTGRPDWIDFSVESVGVLNAKEIIRLAVQRFKTKIDEWLKEAVDNIQKGDGYTIKTKGNHTVGSVAQEIIYNSGDVTFVSYDIPHPLKPDMVIKLVTDKQPEDILKDFKKDFQGYCEILEKEL